MPIATPRHDPAVSLMSVNGRRQALVVSLSSAV